LTSYQAITKLSSPQAASEPASKRASRQAYKPANPNWIAKLQGIFAIQTSGDVLHILLQLIEHCLY